jgi:hypothetical protein
MECCVYQNASLAAVNATNNITFFSCSRDEMPQINTPYDKVPVDGFIILFVAMMLMILLPAAWCCYSCYRQSKQQVALEQHQQERNDDEDATVPDDDSLSMVSI